MNLAELRASVCRANVELGASGLVKATFGNVSGVDRDAGVFAIKPSGVPYEELTPEHMVLVSLDTGEVEESDLRPSSDTPTHLELYRAFPCGGIAHTHSEHATALAQARLPLRCLGTTHADYFRGNIPVTREMTREEVQGAYERNTGLVIVETLAERGCDPGSTQASLVASHGPFAWGETVAGAAENAVALEAVAAMALHTLALDAAAEPIPPALLRKHFQRKHGATAYYGQPQ